MVELSLAFGVRVCIRFTNRFRSIPKGSRIGPEVYLKVRK